MGDAETSYDPPSSLLTPTQRAFLRGERENTTDSNKRAIRRRIRNRLKAGVIDSNLIVNELNVEDIGTALAEPKVAQSQVYQPVGSSIKSLASLMYLHSRRYEVEPEEVMEREIEYGITDALGRLGINTRQVSVDIEVETGEDLSDLADGDLSEVSDETLENLVQNQEITIRQFVDEFSKRQED